MFIRQLFFASFLSGILVPPISVAVVMAVAMAVALVPPHLAFF
jgi:hypothetical protein